MNLSQKSDLSIAIFQPDIAQNLGAMLRLAACLGVKVEIIEPCGFPLSSKILKRTAMDYIEISLIRHHNSYGDFKKGKSGRLVLLSTKSKKSIWDFSFKKNAPGTKIMKNFIDKAAKEELETWYKAVSMV